jgi:hypothetical protein
MKISSKPSKLVDIKLELKSLIDPLVGQEKLSSIEIFNRTDKVENFVLKAALSFEINLVYLETWSF